MIDYSSLKPGVSGMMRVKDDVAFIPACIESCIDALDELVIVYNDCTDDSPRVIEEYSRLRSEKYSLIERFVCPARPLVGAFFWLHQNMMRDGVRERVGEVLASNPSVSMEISEFMGKSFYEIVRMVPKELFNLDLRSLFQFVWAYGKRGVEMNEN